jgi:poly(hydroxyalkanoate) granule-associated protein
MVDDGNKTGGRSGAQDFADTLKGSARQIWLAGVGALARAQQEGGKLFDTLVREGESVQQEFTPGVQERFARARERVAGASTKASDRLERMFEERVAKALDRLDVPLASEVDALRARIDELERSVAALAARAAPRRRSPPADDSKPTAKPETGDQ